MHKGISPIYMDFETWKLIRLLNDEGTFQQQNDSIHFFLRVLYVPRIGCDGNIENLI